MRGRALDTNLPIGFKRCLALQGGSGTVDCLVLCLQMVFLDQGKTLEDERDLDGYRDTVQCLGE